MYPKNNEMNCKYHTHTHTCTCACVHTCTHTHRPLVHQLLSIIYSVAGCLLGTGAKEYSLGPLTHVDFEPLATA